MQSVLSHDLSKVKAAKRIAVVGCCGAGKTIFASRLAGYLELPLVHLDDLYWKPGWERTDSKNWHRIVDEIAKENTWIIDGNYLTTLEARVLKADVVVFLDIPTFTCIRQVVWRDVRRALGEKHSLPQSVRTASGPQPFTNGTLRFWAKVINFNRSIRPKMIDLFQETGCTVIRVTNRSEIEEFFKGCHVQN